MGINGGSKPFKPIISRVKIHFERDSLGLRKVTPSASLKTSLFGFPKNTLKKGKRKPFPTLPSFF
jgi:hypothetical protein